MGFVLDGLDIGGHNIGGFDFDGGTLHVYAGREDTVGRVVSWGLLDRLIACNFEFQVIRRCRLGMIWWGPFYFTRRGTLIFGHLDSQAVGQVCPVCRGFI